MNSVIGSETRREYVPVGSSSAPASEGLRANDGVHVLRSSLVLFLNFLFFGNVMKFILGLVFSLLLAFCVFADEKAVSNQDAAQLRKQLDAMNSLQGDFVQTLIDQKGKKQDESSGSFLVKRPGKFFWDTKVPAPQQLISNQKTIWLYDPDLQTVNVRPFTDDLQKTPALLLTADVDKLRQHFTIKRSENADKTEKFTLTPKVTEGLFQRLTLVFSSAQLIEFNIQDSLGQLTKIVLSNQKLNQSVDDNLFNFVPPAGADIIKNQ
jgi:outer membrane lipoprotein carrier protein